MVNGSVSSGAELTLHRLQDEIEKLPPHSVKRLELYRAKSHLMDAIRIIQRELHDIRN